MPRSDIKLFPTWKSDFAELEKNGKTAVLSGQAVNNLSSEAGSEKTSNYALWIVLQTRVNQNFCW